MVLQREDEIPHPRLFYFATRNFAALLEEANYLRLHFSSFSKLSLLGGKDQVGSPGPFFVATVGIATVAIMASPVLSLVKLS